MAANSLIDFRYCHVDQNIAATAATTATPASIAIRDNEGDNEGTKKGTKRGRLHPWVGSRLVFVQRLERLEPATETTITGIQLRDKVFCFASSHPEIHNHAARPTRPPDEFLLPLQSRIRQYSQPDAKIPS